MDRLSARSMAPIISNLKGLVQSSRFFYTPVALLCIGYLFVAERDSMASAFRQIPLWNLFAPLLLIAIGHGFIAMTTRYLFRALGIQTDYWFVFRIHINRLPARYLPGGIWQTVSRAADFVAEEICAATVLRVMLLEMAIACGLAAVIGALLHLLAEPKQHGLIMAAIAAAGVIGLILAPWLATFRQQHSERFKIDDYSLSVCVFSMVWLLYGTAFFLFLSSVLAAMPWMQAVGVYLVSWLVGFLAFFAPQGIGVFELTASYLVEGDITLAFMSSVLAFRLFSIVADLTIWILYRGIERLFLQVAKPSVGEAATMPIRPES